MKVVPLIIKSSKCFILYLYLFLFLNSKPISQKPAEYCSYLLENSKLNERCTYPSVNRKYQFIHLQSGISKTIALVSNPIVNGKGWLKVQKIFTPSYLLAIST